MADAEHARGRAASSQVAVEHKPFILIPESPIAHFPFVRRLDFETVVAPKDPSSVTPNRLGEEFLEIRQIDFWQVLAHFLEVKPSDVSQKFTDSFDDVLSSESRGRLVEPGPKPLAR